METKFIAAASELPKEVAIAKQRHYRQIFGSAWLEIYWASSLLYKGERLLLIEDQKQPAAWVQFQTGDYSVKFRNFYVEPEFRNRGLSRILLNNLCVIATAHHYNLLETGAKPRDIGLMFLQSLVYPDSDLDGEPSAFGKFLKKNGFVSCQYNKSDLTPEETAAVTAYQALYPQLAGTLKTFKLKVVDEVKRLR